MIKLIKNLKSWVELRRINQDLLIENASLTKELDDMKMRLRRAGSLPYEYFEDENIATVYAESKPYGLYNIMTDEGYNKAVNDSQELIVKTLARSLIDSNLVQIIVKSGKDHLDPFMMGNTTVAAKLKVIPWEQTVRKIQLFPKVEEEYGKNKNADHYGSEARSCGAGVFAPETETGETQKEKEGKFAGNIFFKDGSSASVYEMGPTTTSNG